MGQQSEIKTGLLFKQVVLSHNGTTGLPECKAQFIPYKGENEYLRAIDEVKGKNAKSTKGVFMNLEQIGERLKEIDTHLDTQKKTTPQVDASTLEDVAFSLEMGRVVLQAYMGKLAMKSAPSQVFGKVAQKSSAPENGVVASVPPRSRTMPRDSATRW